MIKNHDASISFHRWEKGAVRGGGRGIDELLCKDMESVLEKEAMCFLILAM